MPQNQNKPSCESGLVINGSCCLLSYSEHRFWGVLHFVWGCILSFTVRVNKDLITSEHLYLSLIGIILRWGFLIWELFFYLLWTFFPHLGSFYVVSSLTTFRPNFTSGLLQVILPWPRLGMLSLVTVSPVITAFHSCCLSHHVFDQVNLWPGWVGFETAIFWQCSPGTAETQRLYPLRHGPRGRSKITWRRPEVKFGRNVVKEETPQKLPRWGKKVHNK